MEQLGDLGFDDRRRGEEGPLEDVHFHEVAGDAEGAHDAHGAEPAAARVPFEGGALPLGGGSAGAGPVERYRTAKVGGSLYSMSTRGECSMGTTAKLRRIAMALSLSIFALLTGPCTVRAGSNAWTSEGPPGDIITVLAIDPSAPSTIYAGTGMRGIFKSMDGGATWAPADNGLTFSGIGALAIDPSAPSNIYAGTYGGGVFRSSDGGLTWVAPSLGHTNPYIASLVIDPSDPSTLYAGTDGGGVSKSTDGGATWGETSAGLPLYNYNMVALAIVPSVPSTLYAGTNGAGLFKSTDAGMSWTAVGKGAVSVGIQALVTDPDMPDTIYAAGRGVYVSRDGGATWSEIDHGISRPLITALAVVPSAPATLYVSTWDGLILKSADEGNTWSEADAGLMNADVMALAVDPTSPATLYAGTVGRGVYKSVDEGVTWVPDATGIADSNAIALAVCTSLPGTLFAGTSSWGSTASAGIFESTNRGKTWKALGVGIRTSLDIMTLAVDPSAPTTLYAGTMVGGYKSTDGGASWVAMNMPPLAIPVNELVIDPLNPAVLYAATGSGLFESNDRGNTWTTTGFGSTELNAIAIDPETPTTLYAGNWIGVFKSRDGGATWVQTVNVGGNYLAIAPSATSTIYTGGEDGLFKSTDGGTTWASIGPVNSGVWCLAIDPVAPSILYAGTYGGGVFRSGDGGTTWIAMNSELPIIGQTVTGQPLFVAINALAVDPSDSSTVYAGTEGHGVFSFTIPPTVSAVKAAVNPYRLIVTGSNFHAAMTATIGTTSWTGVVVRSGSKAMIKGGASLKALLPKGPPVSITISNSDDGGTSSAFMFTR